jgi:hypothetical protein
MQGKLIFIALLASAMTPTVARAGDTIKRQTCAKADEQTQTRVQQREKSQQQQRTRTPDCKPTRTIPPIVDPTPFFLL